MNRTIIFIVDTPILKTYRSYYVLDAFEKAGYNVKMLDVSPIINKSAYKKVTTGLMDYDDKNICRCHTYLEFYQHIDRVSENAIAIDSGAFNIEHKKIYEYLYKKRIPYGYMILNSCYETATEKKGWKRILGLAKQLSLSRMLNIIYRRIPKHYIKIDPASFVINNSSEEVGHYKKRFYCTEETEFLVVHSNTYEEALNMVNEKTIIKEDYCVWLDSYIPYHPDLSQLNAVVDPDRYYAPLRAFFHWIEEEYKIKVIVSAHPRSDYELHPDAYEGFRIVKGETCLLVRDSKFVITAASTSFLYGVTYEKPMIFVYQNELAEQLPSHIAFMNTLANELNTKSLCINKTIYNKDIVDELMKIDKTSYKIVGGKYVCQNFDGTLNGKSYKQQIVDLLERMYSRKLD